MKKKNSIASIAFFILLLIGGNLFVSAELGETAELIITIIFFGTAVFLINIMNSKNKSGNASSHNSRNDWDTLLSEIRRIKKEIINAEYTSHNLNDEYLDDLEPDFSDDHDYSFYTEPQNQQTGNFSNYENIETNLTKEGLKKYKTELKSMVRDGLLTQAQMDEILDQKRKKTKY